MRRSVFQPKGSVVSRNLLETMCQMAGIAGGTLAVLTRVARVGCGVES
jgi:hypothetical protein